MQNQHPHTSVCDGSFSHVDKSNEVSETGKSAFLVCHFKWCCDGDGDFCFIKSKIMAHPTFHLHLFLRGKKSQWINALGSIFSSPDLFSGGIVRSAIWFEVGVAYKATVQNWTKFTQQSVKPSVKSSPWAQKTIPGWSWHLPALRSGTVTVLSM